METQRPAEDSLPFDSKERINAILDRHNRGPLEIGETYLDLWATPHLIRGFVKNSASAVWSLRAHFEVATGRPTGGEYRLINLPPEMEAQFWTLWLAQLHRVNSASHLKVVKVPLDTMRRRIRELQQA